ncbi:pyocin knob domain-containing protein [Lentilactobacillus hilgardii]|uniref:pyocin knob domain-containing protein n=1 Tax=Lentilactobacillus hilgardii TaxID=1588 RepID=UPI0021A5C9D2|nr:pyocin knob domain-containing protein [Lentilactobacillus hilgardii]MCT3396235.1 hypothetical protein [Lentilactobacillus hilgardii]
MATPNVGILTNVGKNLIDQVNAGQTKITFSKIVFSSMDNNQLTDDQIKALTTVAPQEIVVNDPEVTLDNNTGETRIRATGNNEALTDGVYVKTYAVYAKDDSGNEILYGITISPNPNYLPEYDGVTSQAVTYSYKVNIGNTSNITFTNSNDIYVSDTDLAEALQPYAKTIDVNQQLDKKVNATDTANWQKYPITDVTGSLTAYIGTTYQYKSIKQLLDTSVNGFYTTYVDKGVPDTPDSLDNLRGTIQLQSNHVWGILTGELTKVSYYVGGTYNGNTSDLNWIKLANDSAVVHSTDMRKPASDVVGLEDIPNGLYKGSLAKNTDLNTLTQEGIYNFGASLVNFVDSNNHWGTIQIINKSSVLVQYIICTSNIGDQIFFRTQSGNPATWYPWTMVPRFSTDNSLVLPNGEKITPANDTTVIHKDPNTGNTSEDVNFIGKAQKDNKDLLTADQLPSDLARTGQDTNFTDKLQQAGSDVITQGEFVQSDSETDAQSASSNDSSGFYYTEEAD